jgi:myxalamid-type polyketide synthase MxaB
MQKLAIATGEPVLTKNLTAVQTIPTYLKQAVDTLSNGQLISIPINQDTPVIKTYAQLWTRATRILGGLRKQGFLPQQPVIIILDQCQDFVEALWSCWMGGFVPIPLGFGTNYHQLNQSKLKITTILETIDKPIILTTAELAKSCRKYGLFGSNLTLVELEKLENAVEDEDFYVSNSDDLGALFFSSGTTGKPKLVSFTCQGIINRLIDNQPSHPQKIHSLSWLPLDHASASLRMVNPDAIVKVFLPTEAFLLNPLNWLDIIEQYKITKTSITNFGMNLLTQSVASEPERHWDLRSLNNIGIGAETIVPETYQTFLNSLTPFGLNPEVIFTGYGLTECGTVVVGKAELVSLGESSNQYMQLGRPRLGYSIRIVDENNSPINEGKIGQVQVMGPSIIQKYCNSPEETKKLFSIDGWLNTGDLGFIQDGNLAITGRTKDIIIINAQNYSYQEIEQIVNLLEEIDSTATVACAIRQLDSMTDELVIFFGTKSVKKPQELFKIIIEIRTLLATELKINPRYIIPIDKKIIPRTSLGKIQRNILIEKIQLGEFNDLIEKLETLAQEQLKTNYIEPQTETEKIIVKIWSAVFPEQKIGIRTNFFELGGQSLLAAQIIANLGEKFKINLPIHILFEHPTIIELATYIDCERNHHNSLSLSDTSVVALKPEGSKPPLYCVNEISLAQSLASLVDMEQPIYGLNIFGLTTRIKVPFNQLKIRDFAAYIIQDLQAVQPSGPYKLIGFCRNGALTLEIAQQLTNQGKIVELVALIDVIVEKQVLNLWQRFDLFTKFGWFYLFTRIKNSLPSRKKQHLVPVEITKKIQLDKRIYQAYLQAQSEYRFSSYEGRLVAFQSTEWSYKDHSSLRKIAKKGLEYYEIKGLHSHLFKKPYIYDLVEKLNFCLNNNT